MNGNQASETCGCWEVMTYTKNYTWCDRTGCGVTEFTKFYVKSNFGSSVG